MQDPVASGQLLADPVADLAPWVPSTADPWNQAKATHLLRRAGFGLQPTEVDSVVQLGMDRTVDLLLSVQPTPLQENGYRVLPNGEVLALTASVDAHRAQWLWECAHGAYPLREKLALFWHDHFALTISTGNQSPLLTKNINLYRQLGLGKLRDLLLAVTTDPAMLLFLDNYLNGQPDELGVPQINENYARELFELFTMGLDGGYSQTDVREAARCLSGWGLGAYQPLFRVSWHDPGPKTVLGLTINRPQTAAREIEDLIDQILAQPATAKYLCSKVWSYFVSPNPYPALVDTLASSWMASGYDIRSLFNTILRCNFFHGVRAQRQLIKSPADVAIGAIRMLGLPPIGSYQEVGAMVVNMGLPLLLYQDPSGVPEGIAWLDSAGLMGRMNFATELTRLSGSRIAAAYDPSTEIVRANLQSDVQIVDHYLGLLIDGPVPATVRSALIHFMNNNDQGPDPFTLTPAKVQEKVTGLVKLILSLPEFHVF